MNPTLSEIGVAALVVTVGVAVAVWFLRQLAADSNTRMIRMMLHAGVNPKVATEAIMRAARSRCIRCRSKAWCDRWLAGLVEGDNSFCPNSQTFRSLRIVPDPSLLLFWPAPKRKH